MKAKTKQLVRGTEGLQKTTMTGRSKTKPERAAHTFKKGIKDEGRRRKRAIKVQGK